MENMEKILEGARIVPRLEKHEAVISRWQYAGEYAFYDPPEPFRPSRPDRPVDANSFVWVDAGGEVLGHVSYGPDGRIPTVEGYPYPDSHLDIGLGLRPGLCGRGRGAGFVRLCLRFAEERYGSDRFRLSVAAFNARAVKVYERVGFSIECEVTNAVFHNKFYIMTGVRGGA